MTEAEWLASDDPGPMFDFLRNRATDRKRRLLAYCVRDRWWQSMTDDRSRAALEVSERFADGLATEDELYAATEAARVAFVSAAEFFSAADPRVRAAELAYRAVHPGPAHNRAAIEWGHDEVTVCTRIRDIFGNPFRPVSPDPSWLTSTVVALARQIYESRDFGAMPILADALQDAGCDVEDVLNHCRDPHATHVRGCWALDLVLDRN